jgi:hypothetical protein
MVRGDLGIWACWCGTCKSRMGRVSLAGFRQGVIDVWNVWRVRTRKDNDGRRKGKEGEVFFA